MSKTAFGFVIFLLALAGCASPPSAKTASCFGIPCDFSGKLSAEQEKCVPPELRGAFHVESVRNISAIELAGELKRKEKLAEESRDGSRYVALRDYRCVTFPNGVSGMMIVVERYRVEDK
jgi:hypothetical protein